MFPEISSGQIKAAIKAGIMNKTLMLLGCVLPLWISKDLSERQMGKCVKVHYHIYSAEGVLNYNSDNMDEH